MMQPAIMGVTRVCARKRRKRSGQIDTLALNQAVAKILRRLQHWLSILEGIRVKNHMCVLSQAAERRLHRAVI
jgi:hypothetical protein